MMRSIAAPSWMRWFFVVAGLYGLAAVLPLYVTQAGNVSGRGLLFLYGFAGAATATELMYLVIAIDPRRYRAMMPVGLFSKLSFAIPATLLALRGDIPSYGLLLAAIDLALGIGFIVSWWVLRERLSN